MSSELLDGRLFAPEAAQAMLLRYYERMVDPRPIRVRTRPEWLARRPLLRQQVRACLGLDPTPARLPLDARVTGGLERAGYRLERVFFQTWPNVYAGGWLYLPDRVESPCPAILSPHGHWAEGALHPVVQSRGIALARQGYVVMAVDSVHTYRYDVGVNPAGVMTWNNMRALDYLSMRPEVDMERVGCVGESGGGQQTMYLMALDDRVKAAVVVALMSYFKRILAPGPLHCPCNHVPGLMRVADEPEICALFAPRPLLCLSLTGDWTRCFPHAEYGEIQNVYYLWGQLDRLAQEQFEGPHDFNRSMRERAYAWFNRWLRGLDDPAAALEGDVTPEPLDVLRRLGGPPEGSASWEAVGEWTAREAMFVAPRLEGRDSRKSFQTRLRGELTELLGGEVPIAALEPEVHAEGNADGVRWQAVSFRSEPEIRVPAWTWVAADADPIGPGIVLVAPEGKASFGRDGVVTPRSEADGEQRVGPAHAGEERFGAQRQRRGPGPGRGNRGHGAKQRDSASRPVAPAAPGSLRPGPRGEDRPHHAIPMPGPLAVALVAAGYRVVAVDPRLRGELAADWFHNTVLWGRPEAGMAATDLQAAVGYLWQRGDVDRRRTVLLGMGDQGVAAMLAAGLDERVGVTLADCAGTTYQDGGAGLPVIPNVLRHADLPQIASLVGPRPLMLFRVPSERAGFASRRYYDWTRRSFQSLGAEEALTLRTGPLPAPDDLLRWLDAALRLRVKQKG